LIYEEKRRSFIHFKKIVVMRQYLLKISGLAALVLLLHSSGSAQQRDSIDRAPEGGPAGDKLHDNDEIIIKHKTGKDVKVTVEIKDGQVFVNGKPVSEFEDDNLSVRKKKVRIVEDGQSFSIPGPGDIALLDDAIIAPPAPNSPFRNKGGVWSIDGDNWAGNANRAQLGVVSEKSDNEGSGAKVKVVSKGSAAEKAGLKPGDLITKVDEISIAGAGELVEAIHKYKPEDKIVITYKRDGKEQKATVTLGKAKNITLYNYKYDYDLPKMDNFDFQMPPLEYGNSYRGDRFPRLGIKAQDTEDGKGVKVLEVAEESPAGKVGIKEGDIITRFDGKEVNSAIILAEVAREARGKPGVKINLIRGGKPLELEIKTPKKLRTADL
jgi:serine protease Do